MEDLSARTLPSEHDAVSELIDRTPAHEELRVRFSLGEMQRSAKEAADAVLAETVRCEGNVFLAFHDLNANEAYLPKIEQLVYPSDVAYLRRRAEATTNPRARARYRHAVAVATKRYDDGQTAGQAYIEAFREYRMQDATNDPDAFNALHHMIPLAKTVCRQYGMMDDFKTEGLAFLLDGEIHFAHVKAEMFALVVEDLASFSREDTANLRQFSLDLLEMISAGGDKEIVAVAKLGRRLADRIGEPHRAWLNAEAVALEARIAFAPHPMLVEIVGTRLMRLYHLLGDEEKVLDTIKRMREARAKIEYHTFSGQPDNWTEQVEFYQMEANRLFRESGPYGVLLWVATNKQSMPSVAQVRDHLCEMEANGFGVFTKIATTVVSADERILAEEAAGDRVGDREFHEQYGIWWAFGAVLPFSILMGELVTPGYLRLEHVEKFLEQSWIGAEEDVPYGGGLKQPNDLAKLLISGVRLYFRILRHEASEDELVPALDSLVMRVEAVLRKLARMLDVPALRPTDRRGRPATEHAGLELLMHERVAAACGEDLVVFAKHTLLQEPEGLRDRVGHALLHYGQYRMIDLAAVLFLILRLAAVPIVDSAGNPKPRKQTQEREA